MQNHVRHLRLCRRMVKKWLRGALITRIFADRPLSPQTQVTFFRFPTKSNIDIFPVTASPSPIDNPRPQQPTKWVDFTARARAFLPPPSPTPATPPRGSRPLPTRSPSRSASSPGRVPPPLRLVLSSVTPTVLPRSRPSPVCRDWIVNWEWD